MPSTSLHAKYPDWYYYSCRDNVCKVVKNFGNMRSKGVTKNYTPVHYVSVFMQNLSYFFNRIPKKTNEYGQFTFTYQIVS